MWVLVRGVQLQKVPRPPARVPDMRESQSLLSRDQSSRSLREELKNILQRISLHDNLLDYTSLFCAKPRLFCNPVSTIDRYCGNS